jgi:hypothetical protein
MVCLTLLPLLVAAITLPGCARDVTCTTEVTDAAGTWAGAVTDARPEADLRRESLRVACGKRCAASGPTSTPGCVSRCAVDAEVGKIGVRTSCEEGSSR